MAAAPRALPDAIRPDWPAPPCVSALMSTRLGGVSTVPFDSLNLRPAALGPSDLDSPWAVAENQQRFAQALGAPPLWLHQVHGSSVRRLTRADLAPGADLPTADASISTEPGLGCVVLVADCLPVLFCSRGGEVVGAAHAGWRGLSAGVLDATVAAMVQAAGLPPSDLMAWLGPCIGAEAFEVGADVLQAFGQAAKPQHSGCFRYAPRADGSPRWRADLVGLARQRLLALGLQQISGGHWCTVQHSSRFFSYRRAAVTGRMAAGITRLV